MKFVRILGQLLAILLAAPLVLLATPFWIPELLLSREAMKSARWAKLAKDESGLDWMFSLRDRRPHPGGQSFVRLWGVEFRYHDCNGGLQGFM